MAVDTPAASELRSIAGTDANDDCVLIATAWLGSTARAKRPSGTRPPNIARG